MPHTRKQLPDMIILRIMYYTDVERMSASRVADIINEQMGLRVLTRSAVLGHVKRVRDAYKESRDALDPQHKASVRWVFNEKQKERFDAEREDYLQHR